MIKEKSCGAVIYKIQNDELYFLLLKHNGGHWSFAKGHVEENEIEEQTAIREIKEETNLDVILDTNFRNVHTYSPKEGVIKDVVLFLATPTNLDQIPINQESEIQKVSWFTENESLNILTFQADKNILQEVLKYIRKQFT